MRPGPVHRRGRHQPAHGVQLVIAREDQRLPRHGARALRVLHLLVTALDEHVRAEDVQEPLALQHLLPEVAGAVARGMRRVAGAAADVAGPVALVEGEEARLLARQARRHVDLVGVGGEVDQGALLESEDRGVGVAVLPVLPHGAPPGLTGHRVLELAGGHRQAVEREDQIHGRAATGMARHLARDRELVARELLKGLRVQTVRRLEPRQPERLAVELEPVAQHVERALEVELPHQRLDDQRLEIVAVQPGHRFPLFEAASPA